MPYVIKNEIIDTTCEICLDTITNNDLCILNCNHCFHTKCIIHNTTLLFPTCSVCRIPIITVQHLHFMMLNDVHFNPVNIGSIMYKNQEQEKVEIDKVYYDIILSHSLSNPDFNFNIYRLKKVILKYYKTIDHVILKILLNCTYITINNTDYHYYGKLIVTCLNDFTFMEHTLKHSLLLFLHLLFQQFTTLIQQSILEFLTMTIPNVNIQLQFYIKQYIDQLIDLFLEQDRFDYFLKNPYY